MATRENFEKLLGSPNVQKMLNLIANAEGVEHGYNTLFGNERFDDLSKHPNISKVFTQTDGKKNRTNAAGRYQFMKNTWDDVSRQLGLKDFSPRNQDIAAVALLARNGALPSVLKGDFQTAVQKSGGTWASLPSSNYPQKKRTWKDLGINNPAREQYETKASDIVAAYKKKQQEQEARPQPNADSGRAQRIIEAYQKARQNGQIKDTATQPQGLPDFDANGVITYEQPQAAPAQPEPSLADKALGLGETALSAATGATGGTLGMLGGTLRQAGREILSGNFGTPEAAQRISQNAAESAADLTYAPRTQTGQEYTQALGEISEPLVALTPALSELALAGQAARGVAPIAQGQAIHTAQAVAPVVERAGQAMQRPIQATANAVRSGVDSVREMAGFERQNSGPAPANMGAAQVPQSVIREQQAVDLPIPVERMTEGQLLRDPMLLKRENELSKLPAGEAYRKLQEEQTAIANMNMDKFNEMTGSKETDLYQIGKNVDDALRKDFQIDRMKTREAYKAADKSEEAKTPVDLTNPVSGVLDEPTTLTDYLNGQVEGATETIIPTARKLAIHHKIATNDAEGNLVPLNPTIQQLERFRSDINAKVNNKENADIRQAAIIKNLVDAHTEPFEGKLYKTARTFRRNQARKWETNQIIKDLIGKKSGTDDRKIAYENVVKRIVNNSSLDDMRQVKRTLLSSGSQEGKQAWQEIQGAVIRDIQQKATAGVAPDAQGQQMISPAALNKAILALENGGKLDFIFGKQGADKLRALNDVSKDLFTVPKSAAVNHSNTNSALALTLDMMAANFTTGLPLPLLTALKSVTRFIKDNKTRARVNKSIITLQKPSSKGGF